MLKQTSLTRWKANIYKTKISNPRSASLLLEHHWHTLSSQNGRFHCMMPGMKIIFFFSMFHFSIIYLMKSLGNFSSFSSLYKCAATYITLNYIHAPLKLKAFEIRSLCIFVAWTTPSLSALWMPYAASYKPEQTAHMRRQIPESADQSYRTHFDMKRLKCIIQD